MKPVSLFLEIKIIKVKMVTMTITGRILTRIAMEAVMAVIVTVVTAGIS